MRGGSRNRAGTVLAGGLLALIVIAGVVIAITGGSSTTPPGKTKSKPPAAPVAVVGGSTGSTCSLPAGSQTIPASAPPAATWQTVGSMQVPQAPSVYGPQRTNGIWNTCFAHSPSGALLAAMNFYAEGTAADTAEVLRHLGVDYPPGAADNKRLDANGPVQIAGYKYVSYSSAKATLQIVLQGPTGELAAVVTYMVWVGTDWRYTTPSATPSAQLLPNLTGYVAWSAFG